MMDSNRRKKPSVQHPWPCPICNGRGWVDSDFYTRFGFATDTARVTCKTCEGKGIVTTE